MTSVSGNKMTECISDYMALLDSMHQGKVSLEYVTPLYNDLVSTAHVMRSSSSDDLDRYEQILLSAAENRNMGLYLTYAPITERKQEAHHEDSENLAWLLNNPPA